jgi:hypothetical protein
MTTIPPKVYQKNTSVRTKSPKQKLIGFVLFLLFLATLFYFFASDKHQSESGKVEKYRTELNNLKNKIKNGEELNEGERNRFCELLWLVERIGINNCQCLARDELLFFVKNQTKIKIPVSAKEFGMGTDFEERKQDILLPDIYEKLLLEENIKRQIFKICKNPDVGIWTENRFVLFTPSKSNHSAHNRSKNNNFVIYTFQSLDKIKE